MYLYNLLFLAIAAVSVTAEEDITRGIIYTKENFEGIRLKIRSANCIRLRKPLTDNIHSINVTLFQECTLYYEPGCGGSEKLALYEDVKDLEDPLVKAVKCVDVDAEL